jgi:glyoxylase-like metal-dependent hydrolase (beta-lactamase superfamily II)
MGLLSRLKNLLPSTAAVKPDKALAHVFKGVTFSFDKNNEVPHFQPLEGIRQLLPVSIYMIPPIYWTNCFVIGGPADGCYIVDPSPKNRAEYEKLTNTLKKFGCTYAGIFVTHHHVDHHQHAPELARDFSLPIVMSETTFQWMQKRYGKNYLENIEVKFAAEGDVLTYWQGEEVTVYEVPGHDYGHLGLAPRSLEWFLVGDLIEDKSTVVIANAEGDMALYFQSLERIIQLDPKILLPSHGMPMQSTARLKQTLEHRKIREQQVLHLHEQGHSPEQMTAIIYKKINRRLRPLALENIKSHLAKLEQENNR